MAPKMHLGADRSRLGEKPYYLPSCGNRASKQVTQDPIAVDCLSCGKTAQGMIENRAKYARLRLIEAVKFYATDDDRERTGAPITLETPLDTPETFTLSSPETWVNAPGKGSTILLYWDFSEQIEVAISAASNIHYARTRALVLDKEPLSEERAIAWIEGYEEEHQWREVGDYWRRQLGYRAEFEITKGGP